MKVEIKVPTGCRKLGLDEIIQDWDELMLGNNEIYPTECAGVSVRRALSLLSCEGAIYIRRIRKGRKK